MILIVVDGMRPDALRRACTPTIDALIEAGSHTFGARSVLPSITLPCHMSMLRGVDVPRHGIVTNAFQRIEPAVPSVFDVAHAAGKRTGMFYNWGELRDVCSPDSLDVAYLYAEISRPRGDVEVAAAAARHIREAPFDFAFVYLGHTDQVGHDHGWMSAEYMAAIERADACVQVVVEACADSGSRTTFLVQSDHGGHDRTHGSDSPEDMTIPWVLSGARARKGERLRRQVRLFDTCPTIARLLDLPASPEWEGSVVEEALEPGETG